MQTPVWIRTSFLVSALLVVAHGSDLMAFAGPTPAGAANADAAEKRDGQHDFDFELGSWKINLKRLVHPLTGSKTWVEFDGTSVTRRFGTGARKSKSSRLTVPAATSKG